MAPSEAMRALQTKLWPVISHHHRCEDIATGLHFLGVLKFGLLQLYVETRCQPLGTVNKTEPGQVRDGPISSRSQSTVCEYMPGHRALSV